MTSHDETCMCAGCMATVINTLRAENLLLWRRLRKLDPLAPPYPKPAESIDPIDSIGGRVVAGKIADEGRG